MEVVGYYTGILNWCGPLVALLLSFYWPVLILKVWQTSD